MADKNNAVYLELNENYGFLKSIVTTLANKNNEKDCKAKYKVCEFPYMTSSNPTDSPFSFFYNQLEIVLQIFK